MSKVKIVDTKMNGNFFFLHLIQLPSGFTFFSSISDKHLYFTGPTFRLCFIQFQQLFNYSEVYFAKMIRLELKTTDRHFELFRGPKYMYYFVLIIEAFSGDLVFSLIYGVF